MVCITVLEEERKKRWTKAEPSRGFRKKKGEGGHARIFPADSFLSSWGSAAR
jgi:hypothetical protein